MIVGASSMVHALSVKNNTVKKELPTTILITTLFIVLLSDSLFDHVASTFTRNDGIVLLLFFLVFIYYLVGMVKIKWKRIQKKIICH